MSGTRNETIYADNVDFSGQSVPSPTMLSNGQLLIGAASGRRIRTGFLANNANMNIGTGPGSITLNPYNCAKFIVDPTANIGTHQTIAAALAAASSGDTIFIRPGTYTENLTLKDGVNLTAFSCDGTVSAQGNETTAHVIILGTVTASFAGQAVMAGIQFKTNGASAIVTSGANVGSLTFNGCSIFANDSTGMTLNATTKLNFYNCVFRSSSTNNLFTCTSTNGIDVENCIFNLSATAAASTIAAGRIVFNACDMHGLNITTSSGGGIFVNACYWQYGDQALLTTAGTGTSEVYNSFLNSDSASTISSGAGTIVNIANCEISSTNTNAITGAGTLNYSGIVFTNTSSTINTTTKTLLPASPSNATSGFVFTSTGANTAPTWQAPAASSISITGNSGGALTGNAFTFTGGTTGLSFAGATSTETLGGTLVVANGGTGVATLTGLALGAGTSNFTGVTFVASTSFTPVLAFGGASVGITYGFQSGNYQRIGSVIIFNIAIILSSKGSSVGLATITGLPVNSSIYTQGFACLPVVSMDVGNAYCTYKIDASSGIIGALYENAPLTGVQTFLSNTNFANNSEIWITGTYLA